MLAEGRHGGRKQLSAYVLHGEPEIGRYSGNGTSLLKCQSQ